MIPPTGTTLVMGYTPTSARALAGRSRASATTVVIVSLRATPPIRAAGAARSLVLPRQYERRTQANTRLACPCKEASSSGRALVRCRVGVDDLLHQVGGGADAGAGRIAV